jgi:MFS transporter, putative metabolite:H+ symporter
MSVVGVSMFFLLFLSPEKNGTFTTALLLLSRSGMSGGYAATWSYTSEVFPTTVRATGLGLANSVAKTASVMSPWIATTLLSISPRIPISIFSVLSFAAAVAAVFLPVETNARELAATVDQIPMEHASYEQAMERLVSENDEIESNDSQPQPRS